MIRYLVLVLMALLLCGCAASRENLTWERGSGWEVMGDLEMGTYSIDGDSSTGLYLDPDNDATNEIVIDASGNVGIGSAIPIHELDIMGSTSELIGVGTSASADAFLVGVGTVDTDITYLRMKNADGETVYIYGNADQNGITVSGTAP